MTTNLLAMTVLALASCLTLSAQVPAPKLTPDQPQKSPADSAYGPALALINRAERQDSPVSNGSDIFDAGMKAFLAFPEDARAKKVLNYLALLPQLLSGSDLAIYEEKFTGRTAALLASAAVPETTKEGLMDMEAWHEFARLNFDPAAPMRNPEALRRKIDALEDRHLESQWVASDIKSLEVIYGDLLTGTDPSAAKAFWNKFAAGADQETNEMVRGKLRLAELELRHMPLEIEFTAADGRPVDLKKLRGKVVLVDFWATWCPFCIAELPGVKKAYETYHDQGFEVVGISCEYAGVDPKDPADVQDKKLEAAKTKLLKFTAARGLPWPQYYDGKGGYNAYAEHLGIDSLPSMFLLDRDGKLAMADTTGEKIEIGPLVKALLSRSETDPL